MMKNRLPGPPHFFRWLICLLGIHKRLEVERRSATWYRFKSSECFYCGDPGTEFEVEL